MAKLSEIKVNIVENMELVSLMCLDESCVHNMRNLEKMVCNLKHVLIARGGACASRQEKAE